MSVWPTSLEKLQHLEGLLVEPKSWGKQQSPVYQMLCELQVWQNSRWIPAFQGMQVFLGQNKKQTSPLLYLDWREVGYLRETEIKSKSFAVSCMCADC